MISPSQVNAPSSQHPSQPSLLRYFLQIQSLSPVQSAQSSLPDSFPPLSIDISTLPTPPRQAVVPPVKAKKEKKPAAADGVMASVTAAASAVSDTAVSAAAAVGSAVQAVVGGGEVKEGKKKDKEKKEKPEKAAPPAKEEPSGPMPSMIDMRVGKVLDGQSSRCSSRSPKPQEKRLS